MHIIAFATQPGGMHRCLKCKVIFARALTDGIKMICYRTETIMLNLVAPFFPRSTEEGRAFLKSVFQQPADIIPDMEEKKLLVRFHTMPTPRENRALLQLCEIITEESYVYPGTDLKMVF